MMSSPSRPLLLDLFCGAGGAAMGYHRAGFDVVGVDIKPQPHYPFEFHQADALVLHLPFVMEFHTVHASPPCQAYSTTRTLHEAKYPKLIEDVRALLVVAGLPYIIENVVGAPLLNPVKLCGSSFGLPVWRHRLFESNAALMVPPCAHSWSPEPLDVTGTGARRLGPRLDGAGGNSRKPESLEQARAALGIDWMTRPELSEAIPPAYTEFIGAQLLEHLERVA
jgi:DNA (cytosine-5)-methyltransferase 1